MNNENAPKIMPYPADPFPAATGTFVLSEMEGLDTIGVRTVVFSWNKKEPRVTRALVHEWMGKHSRAGAVAPQEVGSHKNLLQEREADLILRKNEILFSWKNVPDKNALLRHILSCLKKYCIAVKNKDIAYMHGLFRAVRQLPGVIAHRLRLAAKNRTCTDKHILWLSQQTRGEVSRQ